MLYVSEATSDSSDPKPRSRKVAVAHGGANVGGSRRRKPRDSLVVRLPTPPLAKAQILLLPPPHVATFFKEDGGGGAGGANRRPATTVSKLVGIAVTDNILLTGVHNCDTCAAVQMPTKRGVVPAHALALYHFCLPHPYLHHHHGRENI